MSEIKKVKKLNVSFVKFVSELVKNKVSVISEKVKENYENNLELNFSNVGRVSKRSLRVELRGVLESVLKEENIKFSEYKEMLNLMNENKRSSNNNYIEVIIKK